MERIIRLTVPVFRELLKVCVCDFFILLGGLWDLIVLVPDHCLSSYFSFLFFTNRKLG